MPRTSRPNAGQSLGRRVPAGTVSRGRARAGIDTLSIDIGGSGVKAVVLDERGRPIVERVRVETPKGARPEAIVDLVAGVVDRFPPFHRVSVGFPGVVRNGRVLTAPNLACRKWRGFELARALERRFRKPVRIVNDADMHALGVARGRGVELVVTLGTGFGTGLVHDGRLVPHLEISHLPFRKGENYDEQIGDKARRRIGDEKWSSRVRKAIANLRVLVNFDHLYLGGGNAKRLTFPLGSNTTRVTNQQGIRGGVALWRT